MTKLSRIRHDHRGSGALHELVNLFGFVDERTFLTKSGDIGVVIRIRGVDDECLDPDQLDRIARRFEATLKQSLRSAAAALCRRAIDELVAARSREGA